MPISPIRQINPVRRALPVLLALCALLFWSRAHAADTADDLYFDSDGTRIHYIIKGAGEPVLLIHGFTASIPMQWGGPGIIDALATDYQVIALDNRGHGKSGKPHDPAQYGMKMIQDQVNLLDHLKIKKAHIVGYSMGGFITLKMLTLHPGRFKTATLGGAGWGKAEDTKQFALIGELADSLEQGRGFGPLLNRLTPAGKPPLTEEQIRGANTVMSMVNDVKALAAVARGMNIMTETEAEIRAIRIPTLSIIGEIDPLKTNVDPLVGVLPDFKMVVIPGADHMTAFTRPMFSESLRAFLASHK